MPVLAVATAACAEPSRSTNQILRELPYDSFTYTIQRRSGAASAPK
ncbi:MAG: hypothetical protein ACREDA_09160 [Methylocella sp.]